MNSYHRDGKAINPQLLLPSPVSVSLFFSLSFCSFLPASSNPDQAGVTLASVCDISKHADKRPYVYDQGLDKYWSGEIIKEQTEKQSAERQR